MTAGIVGQSEIGQFLARHTRAAIFAPFAPVAFATNGTVRLARGLTSIRYTSSSFTAN